MRLEAAMKRPAARAMSPGIVTLHPGDAVIIMGGSHSEDGETDRRFNETVRNLLNTPHKPHKPASKSEDAVDVSFAEAAATFLGEAVRFAPTEPETPPRRLGR